MFKDILTFLQWQWRKWEFWQKCYILSAPLLGAGLAVDDPYRSYLVAVPVLICFTFMIKWFIIEPIKSSWTRFQEDKKNLFNTIKEGKK